MNQSRTYAGSTLLKQHRKAITPRLWLILLIGLGACGPQQPPIPNDLDPIAHRCYEALATPEHSPQLEPPAALEDGTFLILWSMPDALNEQGSCTVDGNGTVLLITRATRDLQQTSTPQ